MYKETYRMILISEMAQDIFIQKYPNYLMEHANLGTCLCKC